MPNPITMIQRATSRPVSVKPEPITPLPEHQYADDNNPYRGIESHGVPSTHVDYPDYTDIQGRTVIVYEAEADDTPPIPVRIVSGESRREFRRFRTNRLTVGATGTQSPYTQLVGRNDTRTSVQITNTHATATIYVGPDAENLLISGYPVGPGKDFSSNSEDAVWAMSADQITPVTVGIKWEFVVSE